MALNSAAFRGLTAALLLFLFIIYVGNWAGTIWRISQGTALGIPQQKDQEDEQARNKKARVDRYMVRDGNVNGHTSGSNV